MDKTKTFSRNLEITLKLTDNTYCAELYEPETGDFARVEADITDANAIRDMYARLTAELDGWLEVLLDDRREG